eukprot:g15333.t1
MHTVKEGHSEGLPCAGDNQLAPAWGPNEEGVPNILEWMPFSVTDDSRKTTFKSTIFHAASVMEDSNEGKSTTFPGTEEEDTTLAVQLAQQLSELEQREAIKQQQDILDFFAPVIPK